MVLALKVQVWSKLYIEATVRSARLSVSVSTIFLVSVSKIHIFLVSVSNICEWESRSRLLRLYLFSLGLACWDCTCSDSVLNLKNWSRSSLSCLGQDCDRKLIKYWIWKKNWKWFFLLIAIQCYKWLGPNMLFPFCCWFYLKFITPLQDFCWILRVTHIPFNWSINLNIQFN